MEAPEGSVVDEELYHVRPRRALCLLESIIRQEVQRGVLYVNHSVVPGHTAEVRRRDGGFLSRARVWEEPMQARRFA